MPHHKTQFKNYDRNFIFDGNLSFLVCIWTISIINNTKMYAKILYILLTIITNETIFREIFV